MGIILNTFKTNYLTVVIKSEIQSVKMPHKHHLNEPPAPIPSPHNSNGLGATKQQLEYIL